MTLLSGLAGWLLQHLLTFIVGIISGVVANIMAKRRIEEAAKKKAEEDAKKAEAITPDSSESDVDSAINDISKHM